MTTNNKKTVIDTAGLSANRGAKKAFGWATFGLATAVTFTAKGVKDICLGFDDNFQSTQEVFGSTKSSASLGKEYGLTKYHETFDDMFVDDKPEEKEKDDKK